MTTGAEALRLLSALVEVGTKAADARPDEWYTPGPTIAAFHGSRDCRRRLLRAPNQVGKTLAGGWEANAYSLSMPGSVGLVVIADFERHYKGFCRKVWEVIARDQLDPACKYIEGKGFYTHGSRGIKYRNGTVWEFRSGRSDVQALEGITADWVWVDEVPSADHWGGIVRATVARNAPLWMTFTPIGRPVRWLREKVEGNPATNTPPDLDADGEPMWRQFVPELSVVECHWLTAQRIQEIIEEYPAEERPQRARGEWEGITTDRAFSAFVEAQCVEGYEAPPPQAQWGLGADHGELAGREVVQLVAWVERPDWVEFWVVDEYVSTTRSDETEDARGILAMLGRNNVNPYRITKAKGDTNSGGKGAKGDSINQMISRAIALQLGHAPHMPPFRFEPADKRGGMMAAGVKLINVGLARSQFWVHPRCVHTRAGLRHWSGQDDEYKHAMDALRYIATDVLDRATLPVVQRGR